MQLTPLDHCGSIAVQCVSYLSQIIAVFLQDFTQTISSLSAINGTACIFLLILNKLIPSGFERFLQ